MKIQYVYYLIIPSLYQNFINLQKKQLNEKVTYVTICGRKKIRKLAYELDMFLGYFCQM